MLTGVGLVHTGGWTLTLQRSLPTCFLWPKEKWLQPATTAHFVLVDTSEGLHSSSCSALWLDQGSGCYPVKPGNPPGSEIASFSECIPTVQLSSWAISWPGPRAISQSCPWSCGFQSPRPFSAAPRTWGTHPFLSPWFLWTATLLFEHVERWSLIWHHLQTWRPWSPPQVTDRDIAHVRLQGRPFGIPQSTSLQSDMTSGHHI